jgi:DNA-binding NtrC family response regulator
VELVVLDASSRPSRATQLLEALRAADSTIPVIVIAGPDSESREEAARLGAEAVLDSPLDLSRLRVAAETLVPALREFDREVETRGYSFH